MEDAELDLRNVAVKRWRTRGVDRIKWTSVVRETKAKLTWLSCWRIRRYKVCMSSTVDWKSWSTRTV